MSSVALGKQTPSLHLVLLLFTSYKNSFLLVNSHINHLGTPITKLRHSPQRPSYTHIRRLPTTWNKRELPSEW